MAPRRLFPWLFLMLFAAAWLAPAAARADSTGLPDFTSLVETNAPAVVTITTTREQLQKLDKVRRGLEWLPKGHPLREFFERFQDPRPGTGEAPIRPSIGSGFIIDDTGYIITNNHVVQEAEEIYVRLQDRREFPAELVGTDKLSDIAVVRIQAKNLLAVTPGDSSQLRVGEWVVAIGSPFGVFENTVSAGIVSAIGRSLPSENYVPFIQTDVAINPGNSGGPLINLKGEIVGVNAQIFTGSGGYMGVSFAVPINVVMGVYRQIREKGKVVRGWLGVYIQDVTQELAEYFGMEQPRGALVNRVLPDSPAQVSGLETGDIIVTFDKRDILYSRDLPPLVGSSQAGSRIQADILRKGELQSIELEIGELESPEQAEGRVNPVSRDWVLGMKLKHLAEEERERTELPGYGLLVEELREGPAQRAGVRKGDLLLMLNNEKIKDLRQLRKLVRGLPQGRTVAVLVQRGTFSLFLALKAE